MKKIVCLLQGLTDVALKDLGELTPLQKAHCPTLDAIARSGRRILLTPPECGGFETALMALLSGTKVDGIIPQGPLEALSLGYVLTPNQVAFSLRFVSLGDGTIVDVSDRLISDHEGKLFCRELNMALGNEGVYFMHLSGPRAVLIAEHEVLAEALDQSYRNPLAMAGKRWDEVLPGKKNNDILKSLCERAFEVLQYHEANELKEDLGEAICNGFVLYNGGRQPKADLREAKEGLSKSLIYTSSAVTAGLAKILDLPTLLWSQEQSKYEHLLTILGKLDDIFISKETFYIEIHHLWNSTYQGELLEKVKTIEWLDRYFLKPLVDYCVKKDVDLTLLPVRNTDIRNGELLGGPVPALALRTSGLSVLEEAGPPCFDEVQAKDWEEKLAMESLMFDVQKTGLIV